MLLSRTEKGSVLTLFGILLAVILVAASFTIDQSRGVLAHRSTENLADSLALAAVGGLDGTITGWQNAKRMIVRTLQNSDLREISQSQFAAVSGFNSGATTDVSYESNSAYQKQSILINNRVVVDVERGLYGSRGFEVLESSATAYGVPTPLIANAVRVRVSLLDTELPLADAGVILASSGQERFAKFSHVVGESLAIRDNETETPVAPFAIPACYLLSNLNPYDKAQYQSSSFDAAANCQREVIARSPEVMEADFDVRPDLREGIMRADTYPRNPLVNYTQAATQVGVDGTTSGSLCFSDPTLGIHQNCKATAIRAFLGAPGVSNTTIDVSELTTFFEMARSGNLMAGIGDSFNPIEDDSYLDNAGLRNALKDFIQLGNNTTIRDSFYSGNFPADNFPFRRNLTSPSVTQGLDSSAYLDPFIELRVTWPENIGGEIKERSLLMADAGDYSSSTANVVPGVSGESYRYTNPMCHTGGIPHDHDLAAKVKKVNVMVVGSANHDYCDLNAVFTHGDQKSQPPRSITEPVIVGFVEANVFDFRIDKLAHTPVFPAAYGIPELKDENPFAFDFLYDNEALKSYFEDMEDYMVDHEDYLACNTCKNAGFPMPECKDFGAVAAGTEDCLDRPDRPAKPATPAWMNSCFHKDPSADSLLERMFGLDSLKRADIGLPIGPAASDVASDCSSLSDPQCLPACSELCGGSRSSFNIKKDSANFQLDDLRNIIHQTSNPSFFGKLFGKKPKSNTKLHTDKGVSGANLANGPWGTVRFSGEDLACVQDLQGSGICSGELIKKSGNTYVSPPPLNGGEDGWCSVICAKASTTNMQNTCQQHCAIHHSNRVEATSAVPDKAERDYLAEMNKKAAELKAAIIAALQATGDMNRFTDVSNWSPLGPGYQGGTSGIRVTDILTPIDTDDGELSYRFPSGRFYRGCDMDDEDQCQADIDTFISDAINGTYNHCHSSDADHYDDCVASLDRLHQQFTQDPYGGLNPDTINFDTTVHYVSKPGKRCLPRKYNDCADVNDPNCWEPPTDRAAGWGCAGVRMRLSCESNSFLSPSNKVAELRPALIE